MVDTCVDELLFVVVFLVESYNQSNVFAFEIGNIITETQRAVAPRSNSFDKGGPSKGKYLALDDPIQISILLLA